MPDDIVEVKEKINWKEEFVIQGKIVRNSIRSQHSKTSLEFKVWYNLIPSALLDQTIADTWTKFDLTSSPRDPDVWLDLFNKFWNWAWDHALVLTTQEYDQLSTDWNELGRMIKRRDKSGLKEWAIAGIDQNSY